MSKKNGKAKLPKEVAGMKVPKNLRKAANKLIADVQTPQAQEALVAGAAVVATAATAFVQRAAIARVVDEAKRQAETVVTRIADDLERERATTPPAETPWLGLVATAMNAALAGLRQPPLNDREQTTGEPASSRRD